MEQLTKNQAVATSQEAVQNQNEPQLRDENAHNDKYIQGSNVPNPDEAVPSFVSGAMAKAGKGLLEGTLQAGTSAVSDKLLDLVGLGGKSAADKGKDTRDYLAAAFPE